MGIKTENIAAESATPSLDPTETDVMSSAPGSPYSPENLLYYHTSLGLVETLVKRGVLTREDFKKACVLLTRKYGLPADSIFAECPT
jgi:hypothetical protein